MSDADEKRKLYKQILSWGDPHAVFARMRELGFWPPREPMPGDPPDEVAERKGIEAQLLELRAKHAAIKNPQQALEQERKRRWDESKARRAEKKKERAAEKKAREESWAKQRVETVTHLGVGVSDGLEQRQSDEAKLTSLGLPVLHSGADVAQAMGIDLGALKWLTYHRKGAALVHYHRYDVPKKTGGVRQISAPKPRLAKAQNWVLANVLNELECAPQAHGFLTGKSIVTNAGPHVGRKVVVNMDVKDFFPTFTFRRVKGLFVKRAGYSENVATVLALLCTEPPRVPTRWDGKQYWVALGDRVLPQGACTSPMITNLICVHLDKRLSGLATAFGLTYTRYADDLTFSGDDASKIGGLLAVVRKVLDDAGLTEHPTKTRVMRQGRRQEVTGLSVNAKLSVPRRDVRTLRAILHNCAKHGLESQNKKGHPDFAAHLRGKVGYITMVDPERGAKLLPALQKALARV